MHRLLHTAVVLLLVPLLLHAPQTRATAPAWGTDVSWTGLLPAPGVSGTVTASIVHDGSLFIGGDFRYAGGEPAQGWARWTGSAWESGPLSNSSSLEAFALHDGQLYAAAGTNLLLIYVWDGSAWVLVGFEGACTFCSVEIRSLVSWNGSLYLATNLDRLYAWDGSTWSTPLSNEILDLVVHDGQLVAAFPDTLVDSLAADQVAAFDGTAWTPRNGLAGPPSELAVHDAALVAGGVDEGDGSESAHRWNGTGWDPLGSFAGTVHALTSTSLGLAAGGCFSGPADNLAVFDGSSWQDIGGGTDGCVLTLTEGPGGLLVGGEFGYAGGVESHRAVLRQNLAWTALGSQEGGGILAGDYGWNIRGLVSWDGDLIAGGQFQVPGNPVVDGLGRWDGANWHSLRANLDASNPVEDFEIFEGDLVAVGGPFSANGFSAREIIRCDGTTWSPIGDVPGINTYLAVEAWNGTLVAGDMIWGGASWQPLGGTGSGGTVLALETWDGLLVVGTAGPSTGGIAGPLAAWDGTGWIDLAGGPGLSTVRSIAVHDGDLFVCGGGGGVGGVVRFDGTSWSTVGDLLGDKPQDLQSYRGRLYVSVHDGERVQGVGVLDGACWRNLGNGVVSRSWTSQGWTGVDPGRVDRLAVHDGDLVAGGSFNSVAGRPSLGLAAWTDPSLLSVDGRGTVGPPAVGRPFPNPTRSGIRVVLQLPAPGNVVAEVFSPDGRRLARPVAGRYPAGPHELAWDGLDDRGRRPAAGIYFLRVRAGDETVTRKVVVRP